MSATRMVKWIAVASLFGLFVLVGGCFLGACSAVPLGAGGSGGTVAQISEDVQSRYIEERTHQAQAALDGVVGLTQELSALETDIEQLCAIPENTDFYTELAALHERQLQLLDQGATQIATAQRIVADTVTWVDAVADSSDEAARAVAHFQEQLAQSQDGLSNAAALMDYELAVLAARDKLGNPPQELDVAQHGTYYQQTWAAYGDYGAIEAPPCMEDLHGRLVGIWEQAGTFYYDASITNSTSELDRRSLVQATDWFAAREKQVLGKQSWVAAQQYRYAGELMMGKLETGAAPTVDFHAIERISPNLYQSLDSVLDVSICVNEPLDVVMQVELAGLSLAHTTKLTLQPGVNYFELKPELLPSLTAADLESSFTTQLNFTMTDPQGSVLDAQSVSVEVLTLYDYLWYNDAFGYAAQYELFAWLRPGSKEIDELNRRAADYVGQWTDGQFSEINGYQYGEDWYGTLLQVAAIQKAFSDFDIAYIIDTYTPRADQRVLTCAAVFDRKQALCIESSLVMASALLSAGMHPMLIITPGHAQVAVETWADSGRYFLIETTELPYSGLDRSIDSYSSWAYGGLTPVYNDGAGEIAWVESGGSSDTWVRYFNYVEDFESDTYGGIFVLDCSLQRIFGIHGLDGM